MFRLRWWRQTIPVVDLDQSVSDGEAHERTHDLVLRVAFGECRDNGLVAPGPAITEQVENGRRRVGDHGVEIGGGHVAGRHGYPVALTAGR